jgi:hypothetical protein
MRWNILFIALISLQVAGCMRGEKQENRPPSTSIFLESINRTGENRLNSNVRLSWFGTDKDGFVVGYEISFDNENWFFTARTDSVFRFSIEAGSDTTDQDFWIRAIDNDDARDPDPAYLRIPLRNTPPVASIDKATAPEDTALIAATLRWNATDLDGNETIEQVLMKFNDGNWFSIPSNNILTFVLEENQTSGIGEALIYAGAESSARAQKADGVRYNDENVVYIKAIDIAGAESLIDTSAAFYFKQQTSQNLIICGQPAIVRDAINPYAFSGFLGSYDFLDYAVQNGKFQPKFWGPTMNRVFERYNILFAYTDISLYDNQVTGQRSTILAFLSPMIANFNSNNGKSFVTTILSPATDIQTLGIGFPIEGVVTSAGQARLTNDSSMVPVDTVSYPRLSPDGTLAGIVPMIRSIDSEVFYRAQLTKLNNWQGDNLIASLRRRNGNVQQVFFATSLHRFAGNPTELQRLFDQILQDDFDW